MVDMHKVMDETDELSIRKNLLDDINFRWLLLGLAAPLVVLYIVVNKGLNFAPLVSIIILTAALNYGYYYMSVRSVRYYREIFVAEAVLDIAIATTAIIFTGGMKSPMYLIYFFMIVDGCFDYWYGARFYAFLGMMAAAYLGTFLALNSWSFVGPDLFPFLVRLVFLVMIGVLVKSLASEIRAHDTLEKKADDEKEKLYGEIKKSNVKLEEAVRKATENLEKTNLMLVKKNISLLAAHEIYKTANESKDKFELLDMILGIIVPLMKGHGGIIFSSNDVKNKLRIEGIKKLDWGHDYNAGHEIEITPDSELYGVMVRRHALLFENIEEMNDVFMQTAIGGGSCIIAPLITSGDAGGIIIVFNKNPYVYNKTDAELLELLGEQIGTLIYSRELYEEMKVKASGLEKLVKVTINIESSLDVDEIISTALVESIKKLFPYASGLITMLDESNDLKIRAQYGYKGRLLEKEIPTASITGWVFKNNKGLIIKEADKIKFYNREIDSLYLKGNCIIAPITSKGKVVGTMCLSRRELFTREDLYLLTILATHVGSTIEMAKLYEDVKKDYINTVYALAAAVDAKDHYTHGHSTTVMKYSMKIAEALGLSDDEVETIKFAGLLHDIGKIGISENIINKPGKLTNEEYTIIKMHPQLGANIISKIDSLKKLVPLVLSHHEWFNGSGYPLGLRGEEIMLGARIISVADAYSTMTSKRPYRDERSLDYAVKEMQKFSGQQFDPKVVNAFLKVLKEEEAAEKKALAEKARLEDAGKRPEQAVSDDLPEKAKKRIRVKLENGETMDKKDEEFYS
jgi:putative nucleotidyltransferase with HDIG domain